MEETELARATPPRVSQPTKPKLDGGQEKEKFFRCAVPECGKKFRKAMLIARHFNSSHDDLREDKDSWREFSEEVVG